MIEAGEHAVTFRCEDDTLVGILHVPRQSNGLGVVIVVGGPSYRVGSHRQFVLLARRLAGAGHPVLRFDYRGMGDSSGAARTFEAVQQDIEAAVQSFAEQLPELRRVALWGLCDAATAICMAAPKLPRIAGVVLLNPWVRSEGTLARTQVKSYYGNRVLSRDFWRKVLSLRFDFKKSLGEFGGALRRTLQRGAGDRESTTLSARLLRGLTQVHGSILVVLSGNDLTAAEFREAVAEAGEWKKITARPDFVRHDLAAANHTFSKREWYEQVERWTLEWLARL
jgi:exosortase A-associated hydrolase 1